MPHYDVFLNRIVHVPIRMRIEARNEQEAIAEATKKDEQNIRMNDKDNNIKYQFIRCRYVGK